VRSSPYTVTGVPRCGLPASSVTKPTTASPLPKAGAGDIAPSQAAVSAAAAKQRCRQVLFRNSADKCVSSAHSMPWNAGPDHSSSSNDPLRTRNSTRRFSARPSSVALVATGCDSPRPSTVVAVAGIPLLTR
jgi:hypothetical protein